MRNETMNYKFPKPGEDDFYDINEYNRTLDSIDEELMNLEVKKLDKTGDSSQTVTTFEEEVLRENIESGETLSLTHGKIKKWFSEMKDIAFSGRASDVETDGANRFVSDGEKKNWNSKVSAEGDISDTKIQSLDSVSSEFPVPEVGETSRQFLGKVRKFIQDFNNFKSGIITVGKLVNNGSTTAGGYALDARYGKTLFDLYNKLNSDLDNKPLIYQRLFSQSAYSFIKQKGIALLYVHLNGIDMPNIEPYSSYELPFIIPEAYRPLYNVDFVPAIVDANLQIGTYFAIHTDGKVMICTRFNDLHQNTNNSHIYFSTLYPSH